MQQQRSNFRAQDFRRRWKGGEGAGREVPRMGISENEVAGMPVEDLYMLIVMVRFVGRRLVKCSSQCRVVMLRYEKRGDLRTLLLRFVGNECPGEFANCVPGCIWIRAQVI
jgi:hypothetical protein